MEKRIPLTRAELIKHLTGKSAGRRVARREYWAEGPPPTSHLARRRPSLWSYSVPDAPVEFVELKRCPTPAEFVELRLA